MATTVTFRPDATTVNVGVAIVGAATLHAALNDDSDASYGELAQSADIGAVTKVITAPGAGTERHRVAVRFRFTSTTPFTFRGRYDTMFLPTLSGGPGFSTPQTFGSGWVLLPSNLGTIGGKIFEWTFYQSFGTADIGTYRVIEAYADFDIRSQPTFTEDIFDGAGISRDGGTVTDTNAPYLVFGSLNYDGLPAREWTATVKLGSTVVFSQSGLGNPPAQLQVPPLINGSYVGELQISSTIRGSVPFLSVLETVAWTQNFTPPVPPIGTVAVDGCAVDGPNIKVNWTQDTPGGTDWDDPDEVAIEILRTDCRGEEVIHVAGFIPDGSFCDRTMSVNEPGSFCGETAIQALRIPGAPAVAGSPRVDTPDHSSLDIVGDIEMEIDAALLNWQTAQPLALINKSGAYGLFVGNWEEGTPRAIFVYTDTTLTAVRSSVPIPFGVNQRGKLKVTHDVNNGAGGRITTFFVDEGYGYRELEPPIIFGTAGDIDNSANPLRIAQIVDGTFGSPIGHIYGITVRNGIGGTIVANPDFTDPTQWQVGDDNGDTGTDSAGRVWTLVNTATIDFESCLVAYQMRYWGPVNGIMVASNWEYVSAVDVDNPSPGSDWLRGAVSGDIAICPTRTFINPRPFGSFQPIGGGLPTVVLGVPGGRDYSLLLLVSSEADLALLEDIVAQNLVFYQPGDAPDQWMAPGPLSVEMLKIRGKRRASLSLVAVEPQPQPIPASTFPL